MRALHLLVTVASLAAVAPRALPQASPGVSSYDLDLATSKDVLFADDVVAFAVVEADQGVDFNGDGDQTDQVVFVHRPSTGATTNLGLAGYAWTLTDGRMVIQVDEMRQGAVDLNGDGDTLDQVAHVHDVLAGTTTNLGLAMSWARASGELAAMTVIENGQGLDMNGDGDTSDLVLVAIDLPSATATNLGRAVTAISVDPSGFAFATNETHQGGTDLNGDGDVLDYVLHVYDAASQTVTPLGKAVNYSWVEGHGEGLFTVYVPEAEQGGVDLNGDGDTLDQVLHLVRLAIPAADNLGRAGDGNVSGSSQMLAFTVRENDQGGVDLNADGDTFDDVVHVLRLPSGTVSNLGLAGISWPWPFASGGRALFPVYEDMQAQTDLNGDGDSTDAVAFLYDSTTDTAINLALAANALQLDASTGLISVSELSQGADLNGDGDMLDAIVHALDTASGALHNTQSVRLQSKLAHPAVHWTTSEYGNGMVDLNGDGDHQDFVVQSFAPYGAQVANTGLLAFEYEWAAWGDRVVAVVFEGNQGQTDLNGDGDDDDHVLHVGRLPVLFGLSTDVDSISVSSGGEQRFRLEIGPAHAGQIYVLLGSLSGNSPGLLLDGLLLPLVPDLYGLLTLSAPTTAPLSGFVGMLDSLGRSDAPSIALSAGSDPSLAGVRAHHAFVAFDPGGGGVASFTSNPVALNLLP